MARQADDEFAVIACDGIWDVMSSQEVVEKVHAFLANGRPPPQLPDADANDDAGGNTGANAGVAVLAAAASVSEANKKDEDEEEVDNGDEATAKMQTDDEASDNDAGLSMYSGSAKEVSWREKCICMPEAYTRSAGYSSARWPGSWFRMVGECMQGLHEQVAAEQRICTDEMMVGCAAPSSLTKPTLPPW